MTLTQEALKTAYFEGGFENPNDLIIMTREANFFIVGGYHELKMEARDLGLDVMDYVRLEARDYVAANMDKVIYQEGSYEPIN